MTDNAERDELARELFVAENAHQPRSKSISDWVWHAAQPAGMYPNAESYLIMADAVLASGYRKSRPTVRAWAHRLAQQGKQWWRG